MGKQASSSHQELLLQQAEAIRNQLDPDIMLQLQQLGIPMQLQVPETQTLPQLNKGQHQVQQVDFETSVSNRDSGDSTKLQRSAVSVGRSADPMPPADSFDSATAAIGASSSSKQPFPADLNSPDSRFPSASLLGQQVSATSHTKPSGSVMNSGSDSGPYHPGHDRTGVSFVKSASPVQSGPTREEDEEQIQGQEQSGEDMQQSHIPRVHSSMRDGQGNEGYYSGQPQLALVRAITGKSIFLDTISEQDLDKDNLNNHSDDQDQDEDQTSSGLIVAASVATKEIGSGMSQSDFDRDQAVRTLINPSESAVPSTSVSDYYPVQSKAVSPALSRRADASRDFDRSSDGHGDDSPFFAGTLVARQESSSGDSSTVHFQDMRHTRVAGPP